MYYHQEETPNRPIFPYETSVEDRYYEDSDFDISEFPMLAKYIEDDRDWDISEENKTRRLFIQRRIFRKVSTV